MSGVSDRGSSVCVFKCCLEGNGRVNRIIECVDDIVRCTGMVFVFLEQFERNTPYIVDLADRFQVTNCVNCSIQNYQITYVYGNWLN